MVRSMYSCMGIPIPSRMPADMQEDLRRMAEEERKTEAGDANLDAQPVRKRPAERRGVAYKVPLPKKRPRWEEVEDEETDDEEVQEPAREPSRKRKAEASESAVDPEQGSPARAAKKRKRGGRVGSVKPMQVEEDVALDVAEKKMEARKTKAKTKARAAVGVADEEEGDAQVKAEPQRKAKAGTPDRVKARQPRTEGEDESEDESAT